MTEAIAVPAGEESEVNLQVRARKLVRDYYNRRVAPVEDHPLVTTQQVYVVWFSKTLGNWKAMCGTTNPDDCYFEVTHNGEAEETYVDHYEKQGQMVVSTPSIRKERAERAAMREELYTAASTTVNRLKEDGGYDNATIAMKMGISESVVRCLLVK